MFRIGRVCMLLCAIAACADAARPVAIGPDTYSISAMASSSRGGGAGARAIALRDAGGFCQTQGRQILVTNMESATTTAFGDGTSSVTFRCLQEDDPELRRPTYRP